MEDTHAIEIDGPEQSAIDPALADGGLPPVVGVKSYQVFRASRDLPQLTDGRGWTYHHHVDLAAWRGRLYVGWNTCERDEDVWPSRELLSTSSDGIDWESPRELFPQGSSTPLRMYFYRASNDRMLAIAGLRIDTSKTSEDLKGGLLVREIRADHSLGEVYVLQNPGGAATTFAGYTTADDAGFVTACAELLADTVFLEQQDRGRLLGARAMPWHDATNWPGGTMPGTGNGKWVFGKAFSFLRRPDDAIVGVSKMGWTVVSHDNGLTWSRPVVPPTLVTGKAKVWCEPPHDGRYALVYNPSTRQRWPLAIVTSDDGRRFADMRIVQGELPIQRYAGDDRSVGPQYVRGILPWSNDGSREAENAMWLVYSMSKEDIWVSRVPLPIEADESLGEIDEDLAHATSLNRWNVYCPRWCSVRTTSAGLQIERRDPYDHVVLTRRFRRASRVRVEISAVCEPDSRLEAEILSHFGSRVLAHGVINSASAGASPLVLTADGDCSRIVLRTGPHRNIGGKQPVAPGTDVPTPPQRATIQRVRITAD